MLFRSPELQLLQVDKMGGLIEQKGLQDQVGLKLSRAAHQGSSLRQIGGKEDVLQHGHQIGVNLTVQLRL